MILNTFYEANEFVLLVESKKFDESKTLSKIPLVVNCLFACELYLKVLLLKDGLSIKEIKEMSHNLQRLFNSLPENNKLKIDKWMTAFHQKNIFQLLDKLKNDFVNLRYMYLNNEEKEFDFEFIIQFMYKLQYETSMELLGYDIYKKV